MKSDETQPKPTGSRIGQWHFGAVGIESIRSAFRRQVSKNLAVYMAYQVVRYVAPVVLTPYLAHALGRTQFADLVILNSCVWTSTVFMEFGFYLYGVSQTAAAVSRDELSQTVTTIAAGKALLTPLALCVYVALTIWTGLLSRNPGIVVVGAFGAVGYGASFAWFFQGQQRGKTAVFLEAVPQVFYYGVVFALVHKPSDLLITAAAQTVAPLGSLFASLFIVHSTGLFRQVRFTAVCNTISAALPYFIERFCFTLYTAITPTLVAVLSAPIEASYYSIGDRVGIFLATLPTPIFQATVPLVAKTVRLGGGGWRLSLTLVALSTAIVSVAAMVTFLLAGPIIRHFFSSDFYPAIAVARVFCVTSVISAFALALANFGVIPRNAANVMIWSSSAALICGLVSQWLLVPRFGVIGAVISRGMSETIVMVVLSFVVFRMLSRDVALRRNARASVLQAAPHI